MSPVGFIFVPSPPKTGTKLLHPRPPPPIVERVCVFIKLHITAQSDPVIYSLYATACNPPEGYVLWTYCCLKIRVYPATAPLSLSLSLSLSLFIKVVIPFILGVNLQYTFRYNM